MRIIAAAALLLAAAALTACKAEPGPEPAPAPAPAAEMAPLDAGAMPTGTGAMGTDAGAMAPPAAAVAAAAYPLDTCPVSGEKLGSMGDPVVVSHEGVEVRLCCRNCVKTFNANPKKYADMVIAARKK